MPDEVCNNDFSFAANIARMVAGQDDGPWNFTCPDVYQPWGQVGRCCTGTDAEAGHNGGPHKLTVGGLRSTSPHLQSSLAPDAESHRRETLEAIKERFCEDLNQRMENFFTAKHA